MPTGYFSLILHAHLPFVRHPEYPEFLEEAEKAKLDVDPVPGDEVEKLVRELFDTPDAIKARLKSILISS